MKKISVIFGTRPEAIKLCPVVLALKANPALDCKVCVTGQHREMLQQVLDVFGVVPDNDLALMRPNQTLGGLTSRAIEAIDEYLGDERPDVVMVQGDTTTVLCGALAAFYHQIAVGHVEAGLRTRNKYSPFPEEMNRRLTGSIADLNFAPTATSKENLLREGVDISKIFVTGNTVIDALHRTVRADFIFDDELLRSIDYDRKKIILVTTHRRENLGEPMRQVYEALKRIVEEFRDVEIIFPVHKNPKVREIVDAVLGGLKQVHLIDPLDYEPFANLMGRSTIVLTDSGGVQEEAPALGKPVLVLRDTTERPEAVEAGTVKLIGTDSDRVYGETRRLLTDYDEYRRMAAAVNPYGDGHAASRIVRALMIHYGLSGGIFVCSRAQLNTLTINKKKSSTKKGGRHIPCRRLIYIIRSSCVSSVPSPSDPACRFPVTLPSVHTVWLMPLKNIMLVQSERIESSRKCPSPIENALHQKIRRDNVSSSH